MEFENSPKSKNQNCCVPFCPGIKDGDDKTVSYHKFPKSGVKVVLTNSQGETVFCDRKKIWEDRVGADVDINKTSKVCSLHFSKKDYSLHSRQSTSHRILKRTAVPSRYLPDFEYSAFKTFHEQPILLGQKIDVNYNSLRRSARTRKRNSMDEIPKYCKDSTTSSGIWSATASAVNSSSSTRTTPSNIEAVSVSSFESREGTSTISEDQKSDPLRLRIVDSQEGTSTTSYNKKNDLLSLGIVDSTYSSSTTPLNSDVVSVFPFKGREGTSTLSPSQKSDTSSIRSIGSQDSTSTGSSYIDTISSFEMQSSTSVDSPNREILTEVFIFDEVPDSVASFSKSEPPDDVITEEKIDIDLHVLKEESEGKDSFENCYLDMLLMHTSYEIEKFKLPFTPRCN